MGKELRVKAIRNGTVIDHLPCSSVWKVVSVLGLDRYGEAVMVALNLESKSLGRKGLVKVEERFLSREEVDKIALLAPSATVNIVKDYKVVEKFKVEVPKVIENVASCPNQCCASNKEPCPSKFLNEQGLLRCYYCERVYKPEETTIK